VPQFDKLLSKLMEWALYLFLTFAGFGASQAVKLESGEPFVKSRFFLRAFASLFAGLLAGLYGDYSKLSIQLIAAFCGLAGFAGVSFIRMIEPIIFRPFGGMQNNDKSDPPGN